MVYLAGNYDVDTCEEDVAVLLEQVRKLDAGTPTILMMLCT